MATVSNTILKYSDTYKTNLIYANNMRSHINKQHPQMVYLPQYRIINIDRKVYLGFRKVNRNPIESY